jgi:hypothetical protein
MTSQPRSASSPDDAIRLLEIWDRLGRQHVLVGGGCSCGVGGIAVALQDYEQDIVDFLFADAERHDQRGVVAFMRTSAVQAEGGPWDMSRLLEACATAACDPEVRSWVLRRLGRTLESFEKLHGGR